MKNPDAVKRAKWLLNFTTRADVDDGIEAEHRILEEVVGKPNQVEAVSAFFEKHAPRFVDRRGTGMDLDRPPHCFRSSVMGSTCAGSNGHRSMPRPSTTAVVSPQDGRGA